MSYRLSCLEKNYTAALPPLPLAGDLAPVAFTAMCTIRPPSALRLFLLRVVTFLLFSSVQSGTLSSMRHTATALGRHAARPEQDTAMTPDAWLTKRPLAGRAALACHWLARPLADKARQSLNRRRDARVRLSTTFILISRRAREPQCCTRYAYGQEEQGGRRRLAMGPAATPPPSRRLPPPFRFSRRRSGIAIVSITLLFRPLPRAKDTNGPLLLLPIARR